MGFFILISGIKVVSNFLLLPNFTFTMKHWTTNGNILIDFPFKAHLVLT